MLQLAVVLLAKHLAVPQLVAETAVEMAVALQHLAVLQLAVESALLLLAVHLSVADATSLEVA